MSRFNSKEDISPLDEYHLRDTEKSSGTSTHILIAVSYADNHAENHADSSSTYTGHDSEMLSVFDPNYDSNSVLGA
jgi:hypothetical protein